MIEVRSRPARRYGLVAHHEEARLVVWLVLDVGMDDVETVAIRRGFARRWPLHRRVPPRCVRLRRCSPRGVLAGWRSVRPANADTAPRIVRGEHISCTASRSAPRLTRNAWWIGSSTSAQMRSLGGHEAVEGVVHHAPRCCSRTATDAVVGSPGFHFPEHFRHRGERAHLGEMAELLDGGGFRVGAGGA